jgi:T5SS/PEP-CTERM-associated repeat protein/autotransporter-associated beta strand protein
VANTDGRIGGRGVDNTALVTGAGSLWTNSGTLTIGGSLQSGAASGTLTVASGGTVTAAGGITIAALAGDTGTLNLGRFGTNDTAGTIIAPTISFGEGTGAINFNQSDAVTITAAISGAGTINQLGGGTTTLTASNTYTGATTVAAGRLIVDGSIAGSTVTVNRGGTLAGSGSVGGIVLNLGSTINPGNSPGTQSVAGNVVWNAGANYNWQIYDTTLGAGTGWDLVSATGSLDLTALTVGSEFNINLWSLNEIGPDVNGNALNFDPNQNYTWTILTASGGISGFTGSSQFLINTGAINGTGGFANALNGGSFSVVQDNNDLNLVFTSAGGAPVPEPGTWAAAALLAGTAAFMRWRKRAKVS